jgi:hypothetical protein
MLIIVVVDVNAMMDIKEVIVLKEFALFLQLGRISLLRLI